MVRHLSAALLKAGLLAFPLMPLSGCAGGQAMPPAADWAGDPRPLGKTLVYECLGTEFIARVGPGEMAVWLDDRYLVLSRLRGTSAVIYEGADISYRQDGDDITLRAGGQTYPDCVEAPHRAPWEDARRRLVDFRAFGNEPGWLLEIQNGRQLLYVGDYGMQRMMAPDPGATEADGATLYHAVTESSELIVEISDETCTDTMQGDSFPNTVTVLVNGSTLDGCGMYLDHPWE